MEQSLQRRADFDCFEFACHAKWSCRFLAFFFSVDAQFFKAVAFSHFFKAYLLSTLYSTVKGIVITTTG